LYFIRIGKSVIKVSGCSFSFSAKEKEPKRKLPAVPCPVNGLCWGRAIAAEQANAGFGGCNVRSVRAEMLVYYALK